MRICYIGDGGSIHNHFMVEWFQRRGHEVLFLTDSPQPAPPCETRQVAPRRGWGPLRHLWAAYNVRKAVRQWRPDILHAHNVTGYGYWGALSGFSPLVLSAWGSDLILFPQRNPLIRLAVRKSLERAVWIAADAEMLCEKAQELAEKPIDARLLQWGVELPLFDAPVAPELRRRFRGDASFVFLSARRLRPLYNIDIILKAFARALPQLPGARLVIVGDDEMSAALRELAKQLNVSDSVYFAGWISREELTAALLSADAFLSVPRSDSTALSLLEAFAARLPVIVSDLTSNREWIKPNENGLLVEPGNEPALSQAMNELASNREKAMQWGYLNRTIVEERGDREKEMQRLEGWYEELAGRE
ncbi:MAG: glycosyltransferase family 4 protein [Candidatus Omnitrophota bacterium]